MTPMPPISKHSYDQFPFHLYFTKRATQTYGWYRIHQPMHTYLSQIAEKHGFANLKMQLDKMIFPNHKERVSLLYETAKITYTGRLIAHNEEELVELAADLETFLVDKAIKHNRTKAADKPASGPSSRVALWPLPILPALPPAPLPAFHPDIHLSGTDFPYVPAENDWEKTTHSDTKTLIFSDGDGESGSPSPLNFDKALLDVEDTLRTCDREAPYALDAVPENPTLEQGADILLDFMASADAKEPALVTKLPREISKIKEIQYLRTQGHYRFIAPHVEGSERGPIEHLKRADEFAAGAQNTFDAHTKTELFDAAATEYCTLARKYQERKKIHTFFIKAEEKSHSHTHTKKRGHSQVGDAEKKARFVEPIEDPSIDLDAAPALATSVPS